MESEVISSCNLCGTDPVATIDAEHHLCQCTECGFIFDSPLGLIGQRLMGSRQVRLYHDHLLVKEPGTRQRTPWHQDTPYLPVGGNDLAVIWISFDDVDRDSTLEFVKQSHRGTLFDGSRFDPDDDTAPLYDHPDYPRLPDIEANRDLYPIVGWPCSPGDVIVFHPSMLHGGGATSGCQRRRTLSLRYFGEDAVIAERPGAKVANPSKDLHPLHHLRDNPAGSPFRHADFPQTY